MDPRLRRVDHGPADRLPVRCPRARKAPGGHTAVKRSPADRTTADRTLVDRALVIRILVGRTFVGIAPVANALRRAARGALDDRARAGEADAAPVRGAGSDHPPDRAGAAAARIGTIGMFAIGLAIPPPVLASPDRRPVIPIARETIVLRGSTDVGTPTLRLAPPSARVVDPTPLGAGWRHDFDLILTTDGPDLIVRDEQGIRRRFSPVAPDRDPDSVSGARRFAGRRPDDGDIVARNGTHAWRREDATRITFRGSQPVDVSSADGKRIALRYVAGRLVAATVDDDATITFEHAGGRLAGVTLSDGTRFAIRPTGDGGLTVRRRGSAGDCRPDDPGDPAERCDATDRPPGDDFPTGPGIPGATRVDARPASCGSYFVDYHGTERGTAIERGLEGLPHYAGFVATVGSFPVADFIGHEIRVVRTRDLASPTYDEANDGLYERLMRDGREIADDLLEPLARHGRLERTELGRTTTLVHRGDRPVVLELVVRHGFASVDQRAQIARAAAELAVEHGIRLRVIEIP